MNTDNLLKPGRATSEFALTAAFVLTGIVNHFIAQKVGADPASGSQLLTYIGAGAGILYGASRILLKLKYSGALARAEALEAVTSKLVKEVADSGIRDDLKDILQKKSDPAKTVSSDGGEELVATPVNQ